MYTLYYSPGASSFSVHAVLNSLGVPFELVETSINSGKNRRAEYLKLNARGQVPILIEGDKILRESTAILLYLIDKHQSPLLPKEPWQRAKALEWLTFCTTTLQQAYVAYFMMSRVLKDEAMRTEVLRICSKRIQKLWEDIETNLERGAYLCGNGIAVGDIVLTVIANWSQAITPAITLAEKTKALCAKVIKQPYYAKALATEKIEYKVAN